MVVPCPHPNCIPHQQSMCAVPPFSIHFSLIPIVPPSRKYVRCPPFQYIFFSAVSPQGWDEIFYFVGANSFSQKFCPKQQGISSCEKKILTVAWNSFLWQDISLCDNKFLLMPRNVFLWQEFLPVARNSSSDKKILPLTRGFSLQQEISSRDKKFLPLIRDSFKWQEISSYGH